MLKKKLISYWIIFKTYAWLLTAGKGRPKFHKRRKRRKSEQQWLIKIKRRNIQSIQYVRICHAHCFG